MKQKVLAAVLCALALQAHAGVIVDNSVAGSILNNFNALAPGNVAGTIAQTGAAYGERFAGQTLGTAGGFDTLTGTPTAPLTLLSNAVLADNIGLLAFGAPGNNVIYGDLNSTVGEGALSILFAQGTDVLGFDIVGTDGGAFTAQFFDTGGNLLGSLTQGALDGFFGFRTTGGDIIAAVSLTNTDPAGIGFDNFVFNSTNRVPEPGSLALVALGCLGLGLRLRRKTIA